MLTFPDRILPPRTNDHVSLLGRFTLLSGTDTSDRSTRTLLRVTSGGRERRMALPAMVIGLFDHGISALVVIFELGASPLRRLP